MSQKYIINDTIKFKNITPKSMSPQKNEAVKVRSEKLQQARRLKELSRVLFPESGSKAEDLNPPDPSQQEGSPTQAPIATQVLVYRTPSNESLLSSMGVPVGPSVSATDRRWIHYLSARDKLHKIQGLKKDQVQAILDEHFPEFIINPQGLMDYMGLTVDPEMFSSAVHSVDHLAASLKSLNEIKHTIDVTDKAESAIAELSGVFKKLNTALLLVAVVILMKPTTRREKILLSFIVVGFVASQTDLAEIWKSSSLCAWLNSSPPTGVEPQAATTDQLSGMVVGLLNSFIFLGAGKDLLDPNKLSRVIQAISRTEVGVSSITKTVHLLISFVHSSFECFWKGNPWFLQSGHVFIDEFLKEAGEIIRLHEDRKLLDLQSSLDRVRAAIDLGENVSVKIPGAPDTVGLRLQVNNTLSELKKIKKVLLGSNFMNAGLRQEPAAILFRGPPGVGKSQCMQHLAHAVNALTLSEEDFGIYMENPASAIFTRNSETVFWDGYKQSHNVVFMDDLLQPRDVQGNPDNEIMAVIRAVNVFEYPLHCAEMSMKGTTTFRSKFLIGNTNMQNIKLDSINEVGAFMRRWHLAVDVIPKKEFCLNPELPLWQRRFDPSKLQVVTDEDVAHNPTFAHLVGKTKIMPEMCDYHILRMSEDERQFERTSEVLEFPQLVERYYKIFLTQKTRHEIYLKGLSNRLDEYRSMRDAGASQSDVEEEVQMEDILFDQNVLPQASVVSEFVRPPDINLEFDYVSQLNEESRAFITRSSHNPSNPFHIIDVTMKHIFYQAEVLGGMVYIQDAFDVVHAFYEENGYSGNDLFPIVGVSTWPEFFDSFSVQVYMTTIAQKNREMSAVTRSVLQGIDLQRTFIEEHRMSWKIAPTWVSYFHRLYNYTLSHALYYGRSITWDPIGNFRIVVNRIRGSQIARTFYDHLINMASVVAAMKVMTLLIPYVFPTEKKTTKQRIKLVAQNSSDPSVLEAREEFALASATFEIAKKKFESVLIPHLDESDNSPESDERHNRTIKVRRIVKPTIKPVMPQSLQKQNANLVSIMSRVRDRSLFQFLKPAQRPLKPGASHEVSGYAFAVCGRALVFPYHFLSIISSEVEDGLILSSDLVVLRRTVGDYVMFKFTVQELLDAFVPYAEGEERDLVMVNLPSRFQPAPNSIKYIATEEQSVNYLKFDAVLNIPGPQHCELHPVVAEFKNSVMIGDGIEFERYKVKEVFSYNAQTTVGDCGSLLFVNDRSNNNCLIGMHFGGSSTLGVGFSSRITREFIENYMEFLDIDESLPIPDIPDLQETDIITPNMYCMGSLPSGRPYPRSIGRSKIKKSHIHGMAFPPGKYPARLKPFKGDDGQIIDPNKMALAKYCNSDVYIDQSLIDMAVDDLFYSMRSHSRIRIEPEVYSYRVAVLGDESGYWTAVPRSTSSGYPWNCLPGPASKTRFWGTGQDYDLTNPEALKLETRVMVLVEKAKQNFRTTHFFTDSLKDERRSIAKVKAGVTRLISCCPVDLLIAFRMYFGAFQKWLVANRVYNGFAIGLNERSPEWNIVAMELNKFGPADLANKEDGDQAGFDTNHRNSISEAVFAVVCMFYGDSDRIANRVRRVLWREVENSLHLNEGNVFEWFTALPSGAPPTTFFNCTVNQLIMRMAWYRATKDLVQRPRFDDHVYLIVLGDDNVFSVRPDFRYYFNGKAVAKILSTFGYTYTPADKGEGHEVQMKKISEVTFLKRGFRFDQYFGRYVSPLALESIHDMVNWQKESSNSYADCEIIISTALEELVFHGKDIFDRDSKLLFNAIDITPGLTLPTMQTHMQWASMLLAREGAPVYVDVNRSLPGYQGDDDTCDDQIIVPGSGGLRGSLFSDTVRTPQWQPHSSPGSVASSNRLVRRLVPHRTATNSQGNQLTDSVPLGQDEQGLLTQTRLAEETSQQTSDTTKSTVDDSTPVAKPVAYRPLHPSLLDSARTGVSQDVNSFLSKPVSIASGNFTTSDTYATFVWTNDGIPQSLIYAQPMWLNKLAGNMAFRATMHLSLQVNATRFQQGRYMLGWIPSGGGSQFNKFRRFHTASLALATQTPHVEIDLNCDSEATLIIPYVTAQGWASLDPANSGTFGNNGSLFLAAYQPLAISTGTTNCSWQLFCHFSDVEFCMPAPQASRGVRTHVRRKVRAQEVEQDSQNIGPISSGLSSISTAASSLSAIPFISSVAGPLSWATGVAAKVASAFGWSRPHNSEHAAIMQRFIVPKYTNADTSDNSAVLGATDCNGVEELPGFAGTDLDEMSLSYLTSISAYFSKTTWTTSQAQGTLLTSFQLGPRGFYTSDATAGVTTYSLSPLSFFSSFFALYRGGIKLTCKIVKTEFHTGRLMVVFQPYERGSGFPQTVTPANSAYAHREILDVRYGNEFTLEFPYMSTSSYRSTTGDDTAYGVVSIFVLNTLESPPNVPTDITLLFEASAAKDFELAQPCDILGQPTQIYVPQSGRNVCEIVSEKIGGSTSGEDLAPSRLCIGERIMSIRQLVKRFSNNNDGDVPQVSAQFQIWNPFGNNISFLDTNGIVNSITQADTLTWFSTCFALMRGGVRLKLVPLTNESLRTYTALQAYPSNAIPALSAISWSSTSTFWTSNLYGSQKPSAVFSTDTTGGVEIQVPFYHRYGSVAISDTFCTRTAANEGFDYIPAGAVPRNYAITRFSSVPAVKPLQYRAASEDFSFGMFVSTPLITGWSASGL